MKVSDFVTSFVPSVREDCGDVYWSHPAFKGGFGVPNEYVLYVNGMPQAYEPGSEVLVAVDGEPWQVTLKAKYEGLGFEHQHGQHKGVGEAREVVPEEPAEEPEETPEDETGDDDVVDGETEGSDGAVEEGAVEGGGGEDQAGVGENETEDSQAAESVGTLTAAVPVFGDGEVPELVTTTAESVGEPVVLADTGIDLMLPVAIGTSLAVAGLVVLARKIGVKA